MNRNLGAQDSNHPGRIGSLDEAVSSGRSGTRGTVGRLIVLAGLLVALVWICANQWDKDHPVAAWSRGLSSQQPSERIKAVQGVERYGRENTDGALKTLLKALGDSDAEVSAASAMALVTVITASPDVSRLDNVHRATAALIDRLTDPRPIVRAASAEAIGMVSLVAQVPASTLELERTTTALLETLVDGDPTVRLAVVHSLARLGPKVWDDPPPALVAAMKDESEKNGEAVARALLEFRVGLPPMLPSMVATLDKANSQFRTAFLKIIAHVRPPRFTVEALPGLVAALASDDPSVLSAAVASLSKFAYGESGDQRFVNRSTPEFSNYRAAANVAMPALAGALDRLAEAQQSKPKPSDPRLVDVFAAIADCLERMAAGANSQDEALAALTRLIRPTVDPRCRTAAAKALGRFRPSPALFTALTGLIEDHDPAVRIAAMWSIDHADFHEGFVVPRSLAKAIEDPNPEVRGAAAAAMGHSGLGLDSFIPVLLRHAQEDSNSEVRAVCGSVLGICSAPPKVTAACVPSVIPVLSTSDPQLREALCHMLSRLGSASAPAVPALVQAMKNPGQGDNSYSRRWIALTLCEIAPGTTHGDQAAEVVVAFLADPSWQPDSSLIREIAAFGPQAAGAIASLRKLETHNDPEIKKAVSVALAKIQPGG